VNAYRPLFETGQIVLVGGEANIVDFAATKLLQYERDGDRFRRYEAIAAVDGRHTTVPLPDEVGDRGTSRPRGTRV